MKSLTTLFVLLIISQLSFAQTKQYNPTKDNLDARASFADAKFGLFIHWGVYSLLGDGEWVMHNQNIGIEEYDKLPTFFNPISFNAEQWVKMAKDAGMKYITVTSRHHDGFSMFDSKVSDYNIVNQSPFGKDVIGQLVDACHNNDMKIFLYYSILDWHRDDYFPRGRTGTKIGGRKEGKWENYISFMKSQLTELLTNYGRIDGIWFDGEWDNLDANWHFEEIYSLIHQLQPHCLIGNNHHSAAKDGEDFQMFERNLPGKNKDGLGTDADKVTQILPKEVCETINKSWGFNLQDRSNKTHKELIHYLVSAAGYGANLLLNVGPMPNGKIQPDHIESLGKIGEWLRNNGTTNYSIKLENLINQFISNISEYPELGKKLLLVL